MSAFGFAPGTYALSLLLYGIYPCVSLLLSHTILISIVYFARRTREKYFETLPLHFGMMHHAKH